VGSATSTGSTTGALAGGTIAGFQLNIGASSTITFTPLDTNPPHITVTAPAQGAHYFRNDSVVPQVTIVDPEGSSIASTSYKFNGSSVDPTKPLPFNLAPSGTSTATIVVYAADAFGNATTSTTTFTILPPDLSPPQITITNPLKYGIYAKTDTVIAAATIIDQSPIATTTFWFANKKINPAQPLPLSTVSAPSIQTLSVSASDSHGNAATSSIKFFVVKDKNSCLADILAILILITQDKTLPDKPTLQQLVSDCSALIKGFHRHDNDGDH
jgi:hypothetical protein